MSMKVTMNLRNTDGLHPKGDIRIVKGEVETLPGLPEFLNHKSEKHRAIYALFKGLLESERLNQLFQDFHQMVGVPVAIIDLAANVLASSRWQRLCTDFHRADPGTRARCLESDTELANQLKVGSRFTMYRCKNGLTDCASPIVIEGEHVANLFIGQFLLTRPNRDFFIKQAQEFAFQVDEYMEALEEVPVVEELRIPAIMSFLVHFAQMVASMGLEKLHALEVEEQSGQRLKEQVEKRTLALKQQAKELRKEITNRKQAEEALRTANAYNRSLIEASLDPLVTIGPDGRITDVNASTEKITGYPREELIGTDFSIYFTDEVKARAGYQQAFREGIIRNYALELKHTEGRLTPVLYNASVFKDETGQVAGVFAAARDITERKEAEKEIHLLNENLELRVAQRTEELEIKSSELRSSQLALMNIVEDLNLKSAELEQLNKSLQEEIKHRKAAQEEASWLNNDLVKQKLALEAINRELEAFSYSVSHDLRAPLRAIDGFSQALLEDYGGRLDKEADNYLNRIRAASQRMGHLIDDILNLSRLSRFELQIGDVNLSSLAQTIIGELQGTQPDRAVEVVIQGGVMARGDARLLRIALENLLGNAWKFSSLNSLPKIEFGTIAEKNQSIYFVKDNGVGFDMAYSEKLFSPFQRLHSAQEFPGSGIGLATVWRIIARHKGRIWAESEPGRGAIFYFTL